jgi:hypothetical protein
MHFINIPIVYNAQNYHIWLLHVKRFYKANIHFNELKILDYKMVLLMVKYYY